MTVYRTTRWKIQGTVSRSGRSASRARPTRTSRHVGTLVWGRLSFQEIPVWTKILALSIGCFRHTVVEGEGSAVIV